MKTIESALADDHMRHVNGDLLGTLEIIDAGCCPCRAWPDRRPRLCYIYRSLTEAAVLGAYPRLFGHSLDTKKRKPRSKQVKTGKLWKSGRGRMNPTPARENRRIPTIPAGWAEPLHVGSSPTGGTRGRRPENVEIPTFSGLLFFRPHGRLATFWTRKNQSRLWTRSSTRVDTPNRSSSNRSAYTSSVIAALL